MLLPRRSWRAYLRAAAKIFLWIGVLLLVLALAFALHTWWSVRSFVRTEATVTENVPTQSAQQEVVYITHLRFQLPGGKIVTFVDPIQSDENGSPGFAAGEVVPAMYPVGEPDAARIATVWRLYFVANVLGILGVVMADLGLILRRVFKQKNP